MDQICSFVHGHGNVKVSEVPQLRWSSLIIVTCLLCSCITARGTDDWPMFQHDPQHSGYSSSNMPLSLKERWVHEEYGNDRGYFVISGKKLFAAHSSSLSAIDIDDGSSLWSFRKERGLDLELRSFPAVASSRIYVSALQEILCLDADTGEVLWNYEVKLIHLSSSPIVVDGHIIVGSGYFMEPEVVKYAERVLCLDAETGEAIWEFYICDIADYSPAYFDGKVFTNGGGKVYCLEAQTGELIWETKIDWTDFSDLSLDGKRIFVGTSDGVICLELETGDTLWKFQCEEWVFITPAVAYNKVFFGSLDGLFYCLNAENGELVWKMETAGDVPKPKSRIGCSAVVADGKVVFGTGSGLLYIVDAESGEICESHQLDESGIGSIALSDGKLFIGQDNGKITCFEGSTPHEFSPSALIGIAIALLSITLLLAVWMRTRKR
jgi:outer membrane protein assembly factor BamB